MKKYRLLIVGVLLLLVASAGALAYVASEDHLVPVRQLHQAEPANAKRVFFAGNSHLFRHDIPYMVAACVPEGAKPLWYETALSPGVWLAWFSARSSWFNGSGRGFKTIEQGSVEKKWDVIVFQPQSLEPLDYYERFEWGTQRFEALAAELNTKSVMLMPWARTEEGDKYGLYAPEYHDVYGKNRVEQQELLVEATAKAAKSAELAPVGFVFGHIAAAHPKAPLVSNADGNHADLAGAYVIALTLYSTLYEGADTREVTWRPEMLNEKSAAKLRLWTYEALEAWSRRGKTPEAKPEAAKEVAP